jgi:hypothetical protein
MEKPTPDVPEVVLDDLQVSESDLLTLVQERTGAATAEPRRGRDAAVIGVFKGWSPDGEPLVMTADGERAGLPARSTVTLTDEQVGQEVLIVFDAADVTRPIVVGVIQPRRTAGPPSRPLDVVVDGERVTIEAQKEVVIRCGEASITLTRAGKVLIRGKYVLSRSSGSNRIKGASVEVN